MTILSLIGWAVVHGLWQAALIAGVFALVLGCAKRAAPDVRDLIAGTGLALMVILPAVTAVGRLDVLDETLRRPVLTTIDMVVPMPTYLAWRSFLVPVIGTLWLIGVMVGAARIASAWKRAARLRREQTSGASASVVRAVDQLRHTLAIRARVETMESTDARVPMVLGWRRPLILLPTSSVEILTAGQLRAILAHELAHVQRRDYLVNLFQLAADTLLFFHPAARWVSKQMRTEREYCCDDTAIALTDRVTYARALAALDDGRSESVLGVAAASGTLLDRIERIAGRTPRAMTLARGSVVCLSAALAAAAIVAVTAALPPSTPAGAKLRSRRPPASVEPASSSPSLELMKRSR